MEYLIQSQTTRKKRERERDLKQDNINWKGNEIFQRRKQDNTFLIAGLCFWDEQTEASHSWQFGVWELAFWYSKSCISFNLYFYVYTVFPEKDRVLKFLVLLNKFPQTYLPKTRDIYYLKIPISQMSLHSLIKLLAQGPRSLKSRWQRNYPASWSWGSSFKLNVFFW